LNAKRSSDTHSAGDADAAPNELTLALAHNLMAARRELSMSQRTLAAQAGLNRGYLRRIEAGEANAGLGVLMILARAVGKEPSELIKPPSSRSPTKK
jgi:transcriptional regulator with XRE-family HTH domain